MIQELAVTKGAGFSISNYLCLIASVELGLTCILNYLLLLFLLEKGINYLYVSSAAGETTAGSEASYLFVIRGASSLPINYYYLIIPDL